MLAKQSGWVACVTFSYKQNIITTDKERLY